MEVIICIIGQNFLINLFDPSVNVGSGWLNPIQWQMVVQDYWIDSDRIFICWESSGNFLGLFTWGEIFLCQVCLHVAHVGCLILVPLSGAFEILFSVSISTRFQPVSGVESGLSTQDLPPGGLFLDGSCFVQLAVIPISMWNVGSKFPIF